MGHAHSWNNYSWTAYHELGETYGSGRECDVCGEVQEWDYDDDEWR